MVRVVEARSFAVDAKLRVRLWAVFPSVSDLSAGRAHLDRLVWAVFCRVVVKAVTMKALSHVTKIRARNVAGRDLTVEGC